MRVQVTEGAGEASVSEPWLHVALVEPEIPPNTGNVGRLCVGLDLHLHLVHPLGFDTDAKAVRRAGLDYWKHVRCTEHEHTDAFLQWAEGRRLFLYSTHGTRPYTSARHEVGDVLVFGRESKGLPRDWVERLGGYQIPLTGPVRSLNLSNAVAVAVYGAMQQVRPALFQVQP